MRSFPSVLSAVILAISGARLVQGLPAPETSATALQERADGAAGFLSATFLGDVPHVFLHYSKADAPVTFSAFYILATDLDIGKTNWGDAQSHGSRSIHVWESSDGVNWSTERLVELMGPTAGYVWAPSATWDPAANAYAVFWSSQTYAASDADHTGAAEGPFVYYSHTTDLINFTTPQRWESANFGNKVIDQEVADLGNGNLDNYGGPGYSCFQTTDLYTIPYAACDPALSPSGMRHGAVVQVDQSAAPCLSGRKPAKTRDPEAEGDSKCAGQQSGSTVCIHRAVFPARERLRKIEQRDAAVEKSALLETNTRQRLV
ncbi:hypothetical protein L1887_60949 [Cichorium endivia]|nr:hypothetical protein L1887_60949 [Cichorium endivia]